MQIDLRILEINDNKSITELINNKKIWSNLKDYIPFPYSIEDANRFIKQTKNQKPTRSFGIVINGRELCGVIGIILKNDIYRNSGELGYWVGEKYWGKGVTTKAIKLITDYGFEKLKLKQIYAGVFEFNIPSMKALEKNGYKLEGVFENPKTKNNKVLDEYLYKIS